MPSPKTTAPVEPIIVEPNASVPANPESPAALPAPSTTVNTGNSPNLPGNENPLLLPSGETILNSRQEPYPQIIVEGYGKVPMPNGAYVPNNSSTRSSEFTPQVKQQFKLWWTIEKGFPWPQGKVEIHHIQPLKFGGSNSFENLVPLPKDVHDLFTSWWNRFR
jgi:hypothetical protein